MTTPAEPTPGAPTDPGPGALVDKRVVIGVSGGIAAYKAVEVIRRLVDAGAHVTPIMTNAAHRFIGETTLSALASAPVQKSLWDEEDPIPHTRLAQSADVIVVAPATARVIGSYANGISNDLLTATLLATRAPVVVCPAMHTEMWEHPAVQDNLTTLRARGVRIVDPESGRLAGGDIGHGRLAAPAAIVAEIERTVGANDLAGLNVLVTAGGTREPIDPVRVISNNSSGRQGHALAAAASARGAQVTLVTAAIGLATHPGVEVIEVSSASEMGEVVVPLAAEVDVLIMAAAVADFRPASVAQNKIKKSADVDSIALEPTHDFLVDLGRTKPPGQTLVGFAAETESLEDNARAKLERKNLDMIVANDVSLDNVGFGHDTNEVVILSGDGRWPVPLETKRVVADAVLDAVIRIRGSASDVATR